MSAVTAPGLSPGAKPGERNTAGEKNAPSVKKKMHPLRLTFFFLPPNQNWETILGCGGVSTQTTTFFFSRQVKHATLRTPRITTSIFLRTVDATSEASAGHGEGLSTTLFNWRRNAELPRSAHFGSKHWFRIFDANNTLGHHVRPR